MCRCRGWGWVGGWVGLSIPVKTCGSLPRFVLLLLHKISPRVINRLHYIKL